MTFTRQCATVFALLASGCGDGRDVHLGTARALPSLPDTGAPEGGVPDASADGAGDAPATCNGATSVGPELTAFLSECEGAGCAATGGRDGCLYEVTHNRDDDSAGSLRAALSLDRPAWITFRGDYDIVLESHLVPRSDKTIDGRGRNVTIRDWGIRLENVSNFVIENITFLGRSDLETDGGVDQDDLDAISLVGSGTRDVWVDHCSFLSYPDGLIDISDGATNVTVSYSRFSDHKFVMLFGKNIEDTASVALRATLHHNWFDHTYSYQPRLRYGWVHVYNNLFDEWGDFAIRAVQESRLLTEKNVYLAGEDEEAVTLTATDDDTRDGFVRAVGDDLTLNGALIASNADEAQVLPPNYTYTATTPVADTDAGGTFAQRLRSEAGVRPP